jgi:hypothetical protein
MPGSLSFTRLLATAAAVFAFGAFGVASASAATAGVLPPANPAADCNAQGARVQFSIQNLDGCRAKEGIGPLVLPSNWPILTEPEQMLVLVDLERVNRGLAPIVGLSAELDELASTGAQSGNDPSFPDGGFTGGGGIWFGGKSAIAADYAWMYDDGPNGLDVNEDCPQGGSSSSCWLHRDIILWKGTGGALVGGGGYAEGSNTDSWAFEILSGYQERGLTFTWARELHYFAHKPALESLSLLAHKANSTTKGKKHRKPAPKAPSTGGSSSAGNSGLSIIVG